ncbi:MAG: YggS family pyridoxal phosphate-dependent enzyme [bacterium]
MSRLDALPPEALAEAAQRLRSVRARIADAAERAGRSPDEITLVGVAKRQPLERVLAALSAGVRVLGQSYVQEARAVRPEIEEALTPAATGAPVVSPGALQWRLVGRLQRNKAALAVRLFDVIESVDRPELAESLARQAERQGRRLDVLIQVGLCGEPQKGGCEPSALEPLAERILSLQSLRLCGLMTVPAAHPDPEQARPVFRQLRALREALARLDPDLAKADLSMGMSADLDVAVEEGATLVRVGTALFGERLEPRQRGGGEG